MSSVGIDNGNVNVKPDSSFACRTSGDAGLTFGNTTGRNAGLGVATLSLTGLTRADGLLVGFSSKYFIRQ